MTGTNNIAYTGEVRRSNSTISPTQRCPESSTYEIYHYRHSTDIPSLCSCGARGYLPICFLAFIGYVFWAGPSCSAYRIGQRMDETKLFRKEYLNSVR